MNVTAYTSLSGPAEAEVEAKRSRFLAHLAPAADEEAARAVSTRPGARTTTSGTTAARSSSGRAGGPSAATTTANRPAPRAPRCSTCCAAAA